MMPFREGGAARQLSTTGRGRGMLPAPRPTSGDTEAKGVERERRARKSRPGRRRDRPPLRDRATFPKRHSSPWLYPFSDPLVEGTASGWRGSFSTANLSARATALKQLSAIWWLLAP